MLVNPLVISRQDYCNSLLYGILKYQRDKLQRIQNTAARLLTKRSDHATPLLKNLHWLPVEQRIDFKIFFTTFMYEVLHGQSADYFKPLIEVNCPPRPCCVYFFVLKQLKLTVMVAGPFRLPYSTPGGIKKANTVNCFKTKLKTFFQLGAYCLYIIKLRKVSFPFVKSLKGAFGLR